MCHNLADSQSTWLHRCCAAVRAMASEGSYDYDLFTIGGGSGGVRGSRFSGTFGAKVAIAELPFAYESGDNAGGLGGTCVLRGCVPKKLVMYCSEYRQYFKDAQGFGCSSGFLCWQMLHAPSRT